MTPSQSGSEKEFRVLHVEDNLDWQNTVRGIVEDMGGILVKTVSSVETAMSAIATLEKLKIDIVILDGSLSSHEEGDRDAKVILAAIKKQKRKVKTIGLSGGKIHGVDKDLGKNKVSELEATILKLFAS